MVDFSALRLPELLCRHQRVPVEPYRFKCFTGRAGCEYLNFFGMGNGIVLVYGMFGFSPVFLEIRRGGAEGIWRPRGDLNPRSPP